MLAAMRQSKAEIGDLSWYFLGRQSHNSALSGVSSGGFKLWECAVDLAQHLCKEYSLDKLITSKTDPNHGLVGKRVLELGCGQGLPGIVPLLAGADVHFQASPCRYFSLYSCTLWFSKPYIVWTASMLQHDRPILLSLDPYTTLPAMKCLMKRTST